MANNHLPAALRKLLAAERTGHAASREIGDYCRRERIRRGLTVREAAERIGVARENLSRFERHRGGDSKIRRLLFALYQWSDPA